MAPGVAGIIDHDRNGRVGDEHFQVSFFVAQAVDIAGFGVEFQAEALIFQHGLAGFGQAQRSLPAGAVDHAVDAVAQRGQVGDEAQALAPGRGLGLDELEGNLAVLIVHAGFDRRSGCPISSLDVGLDLPGVRVEDHDGDQPGFRLDIDLPGQRLDCAVERPVGDRHRFAETGRGHHRRRLPGWCRPGYRGTG